MAIHGAQLLTITIHTLSFTVQIIISWDEPCNIPAGPLLLHLLLNLGQNIAMQCVTMF